MMQDEHIPQEDLVLYAMQAMRSHELAAVRLHLDQCAECRQALAEVNGDLALLAVSVEQKALPEGARERFMARISSEAGGTEGSRSTGSISIDSKRPARRAAVWIGWLAAAASLLFAFSLQQK